MKFIEKLKVIERIDQLIRLKATGNPNELASKLGMSRSTVYEIIDCMKQMGADIKFCKAKRCFYYEQRKVLAIGFVEENKIKGGNSILFLECSILSDNMI